MNEIKLTKKQIIDLAEPFHNISLGDYSFNLDGFASAILAAFAAVEMDKNVGDTQQVKL